MAVARDRKAVYRVDFKARTVKPIFTVANDDDIGG